MPAGGQGKVSVIQVDPDTGDEIQRFDCIAAAVKSLGVSHGAITKSCDKKQRTWAGHRFLYEGQEFVSDKPDLDGFLPYPHNNKYLVSRDGRVFSIARWKFLIPRL
jgi:hypothetical protein